ncbi:MAG TPA: LacI family transcriptional regulator [Ruminococcaceae bacterium]|nr:LacI family transcriptional regulator [Oscillospiraceae bacterium]
MKKILSLILSALICALCLTSCSGGEAEKDGYKIAFVPKLTSVPWFERMEDAVSDYNKENGTDYFYGGSTDTAGQVTYLEQLLAEDWDAICVVPYDTESIAPLLEKAKQDGIVVITHEADSLDPAYFDYDVEAFQSEALGTHYGEILVEKSGGEGAYIQFVGSLNSVTHNIWCDNADKYIAENSNLKKLGRYETNDDTTSAYNQTKELLQAHPEIVAIEGSSSTDVSGIARAVEELGLSGKVTIVGTSLPSVCGEYIESGTITTISLWDPALTAKVMFNLAEKVLDNRDAFSTDGYTTDVEGYEKFTVQGNVLYGNARIDVTKDNIVEYNF